MTYIYPHSNPKILKPGIKFALYREKKPGIEDALPGREKMAEAFIPGLLKLWQQTRIAYLKEPEFKVGEQIYSDNWELWQDTRFVITEIEGDMIKCLDNSSLPSVHRFDKEWCSHYYPGQQYDGEIKYVRKLYSQSGRWIGWQEVEEPEVYPEYDGISLDPPEVAYDTTDEWRQFQEDVDKGIILAEITKQ